MSSVQKKDEKIFPQNFMSNLFISILFPTFSIVIRIGKSFSYKNGIKNFQVPNSNFFPHLSTNQNAGEEDIPYFLIQFPRKLFLVFFFEFGNPKVTVHKGAETI